MTKFEARIRTGSVDLDAALHDSGSGDLDAGKSRWGQRRPRRKPAPAEPGIREPKAFGGDLYPTAAHTTGEDVRYVKVTTWSSGKSPPEEPPR